MSKRPGGELATRPLHFIWIVDCSGSMGGSKIQTLNTAIKEAIPHMREVANDNPYAQVLVRALKFSNGAQWHVSQPTPVSDFKWTDLSAGGVTDMGRAMGMLAEQLRMPPMASRALPPVLVLLSDGMPTDDFNAGLKLLMQEPWGQKAVRLAIAIGGDADHETLQKFIGHLEIKPLQANNPETLIEFIKWSSTVVLKAASSPATQINLANASSNVPIPTAPDPSQFSASKTW